MQDKPGRRRRLHKLIWGRRGLQRTSSVPRRPWLASSRGQIMVRCSTLGRRISYSGIFSCDICITCKVRNVAFFFLPISACINSLWAILQCNPIQFRNLTNRISGFAEYIVKLPAVIVVGHHHTTTPVSHNADPSQLTACIYHLSIVFFFFFGPYCGVALNLKLEGGGFLRQNFFCMKHNTPPQSATSTFLIPIGQFYTGL
jgi:hypothetical protein